MLNNTKILYFTIWPIFYFRLLKTDSQILLGRRDAEFGGSFHKGIWTFNQEWRMWNDNSVPVGNFKVEPPELF